jgi:hypothetical protein
MRAYPLKFALANAPLLALLGCIRLQANHATVEVN